MEIIRTIWTYLIKLVVLNLLLMPFMLLAPVIFFGFPLFLTWRNPHGDFSGLAQLCFWLGPVSCAFWMLISCHLETVRWANREDRLETWRDAEGGIARTVTKATAYMFAGLFGSYFFELALLLIFVLLRFRCSLGLRFALLPFATFAPVILLWLRRWMRTLVARGRTRILEEQ